MSRSRKGVLTTEQEVILEKALKFNNKVAEAADGPAIKLADNQGINRLLDQLDEKVPGASEEFVFPIVDEIMAIVEATLVEE